VTGIEGLLSWWEEDSLIPFCGMKSKSQIRINDSFFNRKKVEARKNNRISGLL